MDPLPTQPPAKRRCLDRSSESIEDFIQSKECKISHCVKAAFKTIHESLSTHKANSRQLYPSMYKIMSEKKVTNQHDKVILCYLLSVHPSSKPHMKRLIDTMTGRYHLIFSIFVNSIKNQIGKENLTVQRLHQQNDSFPKSYPDTAAKLFADSIGESTLKKDASIRCKNVFKLLFDQNGFKSYPLFIQSISTKLSSEYRETLIDFFEKTSSLDNCREESFNLFCNMVVLLLESSEGIGIIQEVISRIGDHEESYISSFLFNLYQALLRIDINKKEKLFDFQFLHSAGLKSFMQNGGGKLILTLLDLSITPPKRNLRFRWQELTSDFFNNPEILSPSDRNRNLISWMFHFSETPQQFWRMTKKVICSQNLDFVTKCHSNSKFIPLFFAFCDSPAMLEELVNLSVSNPTTFEKAFDQKMTELCSMLIASKPSLEHRQNLRLTISIKLDLTHTFNIEKQMAIDFLEVLLNTVTDDFGDLCWKGFLRALDNFSEDTKVFITTYFIKESLAILSNVDPIIDLSDFLNSVLLKIDEQLLGDALVDFRKLSDINLRATFRTYLDHEPHADLKKRVNQLIVL